MSMREHWTCVFEFFVIVSLAYLAALVLSSPTDTIKDENGVVPPIEFPKNKLKYIFKHNKTLLHVLASHTSNDTEVDDLRNGGQFFNLTNPKIPIPEMEKFASGQKNVDPKLQYEEIEDGSETEENKITKANKSVSIKRERNRQSYGTKMPIVQGQLAAILAAAFVSVAVIGYVGMLSWRRFLESRYGNREMLVNEEDFYDPNDMRHFSL